MAVLNNAYDIYLGNKKVDELYLGNNLIWSRSTALLPETRAILNRADDLGFYKPINSTIMAMDNHIRRMMDNGAWWSGLDRYKHFAYNDVLCDNFSLIDWKYPKAALMTIYGGMTYTAQGWQGNKIDGYIDLKYDPASNGINFELENASISSCVYKTHTSSYGRIVSGSYLQFNADNFPYQGLNGTSSIDSLDMSETGSKLITRSNISDITLINKSTVYDRIQSATRLAANIVMFRRGSQFSDIGLMYLSIGSNTNNEMFQSNRSSLNSYLTEIGLRPIA